MRISTGIASGAKSWSSYWTTSNVITAVQSAVTKMDLYFTGLRAISIERAEIDMVFSEIATINAGVKYYQDTVTANKLYFYRYREYSGTHYSDYSNVANNVIGNLSTAVKGEWLFDEGSGLTAIDTAGDNNGTIKGATYVEGISGTALSFNGVANANHVLIGDVLDDIFAGVNKKFAIEAWVKPGVNNMTLNEIISKVDFTNKIYAYLIGLSTGSKVALYWTDGTDGVGPDKWKVNLGSTAITDTDKWYHIVVEYDGTITDYNSRCKIWVDGVRETVTLVAGAGAPVSIKDKTSRLCIGASIDAAGVSSRNFNGLIDSVKIYDTVQSDNNIVLKSYAANPAVIYDETVAEEYRYAMTIEGTLIPLYLFKSSDGLTFTEFKQLSRADEEHVEAKEIIRRPDGKYIIYYSHGHSISRRKIGAFLSDTNDINGMWTDQDTLIDCTSVYEQKYSIGVEYNEGIYYGFVSLYNGSEIKIDLYTSRDGLAWTLFKEDWIPLGASGAWDDGMIMSGRELLKEGNDWRFYYAGHGEPHATYPRGGSVGLAIIGYQRIGGIEGIGTLVTSAFTATEGLFINAFATGLTVELLDSSDDSVIAGYSKDDMDLITGDTYSSEVKWGGNSIPTDQEVKLKFYLSGSAKLYAYDAGSQQDSLVDALYVGTLTGSTYLTNIPVKYASNPIFEPATAKGIWDREKLYCNVLKVGSQYKMYYSAGSVETTPKGVSCLATSTDGITWTKPVVGLFDFTSVY